MTYILASEAEGRGAIDRVARRFRSRREVAPPARCAYLDTFDWRIQRAGCMLRALRDGDRWLLEWRAGDGPPRQDRALARLPAFAGEVPAGRFRESIAKISGLRRLFPVVTTDVERDSLLVLDDDNRTLVTLDHLQGRVLSSRRGADPTLPPRLRLTASPHAGTVAGQVVRYLEAALGLARDPSSDLDRALAAAGLRPGPPGTGLPVKLDPSMRSDAAVKRVLGSLLRVIRRNERGAREALDPEFLHDLRVAVRRTRSCLGQFRDLFPVRAIARFRRDIRWLSGVTGPTRDLDVYLLALDGHQRRLPASRRRDLDPLIDLVRRRRDSEQVRLANAIGSDQYRALVRDWGTFLRKPLPRGGAGSAGSRPIVETASERIRARLDRLVRKGGAIRASSPESDLHRLRVEGKRLRYMIECFRSLYDEETVTPILVDMRRLQDNLGEFNDLRVQRDSLRPLARRLEDREVPAGCLIAVGRLEERLERRLARVRKAFRKRFSRFSGRKSMQQFERLLSVAAPPSRTRSRAAS